MGKDDENGTGIGTLDEAGITYLTYLKEVHNCLAEQEKVVRGLMSLITDAGAVHVYGFGRSGAAALSLAIRLRHFCEHLPPVWWVGDQVRMPLSRGDLLILFSRSGTRPEVATVACKATSAGAKIAAITTNRGIDFGKTPDCTLFLPPCPSTLIYGGGDFELASYFFQEILVSMIGVEKGIPRGDVERYHV